MSEDNLNVIRDHFEATNERDFPRAMRHYAKDVELSVAPSGFLETGTVKGRDAVGHWFGRWLATFEPDYRFDLEELRDLGDAVLVVAADGGRGRSSGVEVHTATAYLYRLDQGKTVHAALYRTRDEALEAAGLSE